MLDTLVKPYAPGLATISRRMLKVSTGITCKPACFKPPNNASLYALESAVPCAIPMAPPAREDGVRPMSGRFGTITYCAPAALSVATMPTWSATAAPMVACTGAPAATANRSLAPPHTV